MLDGALFTDARARRARLGSRACLWVESLPRGGTSLNEVRDAAPL